MSPCRFPQHAYAELNGGAEGSVLTLSKIATFISIPVIKRHGDRGQCPLNEFKRGRGYAGIPSTMESAAAVGMIRLNRQRAAANKSRNSFSVRSQPPGKISICRSRNLPGEKSLPG